MMKKWGLIIIGLMLAAGSAPAGEIASNLDHQMAEMKDQDLIKVLVVLQDQTDIKTLDQQLRADKSTLSARHRTVVTALREKAQSSQLDLLETLAAEKSRGGIAGYTPHWIINAIVVQSTVGFIYELANHPDVKIIEQDMVIEPIDPVMVKEAVLPTEKNGNSFIAPGLITLGADRVWNELGINGTGTLVANMDSGVDGTHPALASRWRGNTAPAASAWRDLANVGSPDFPFDVAGHGTHVMGTITGATPFDTLGVAPGAEWIASNAVASSIAEFDNAVIASFEWLADPDGNPETHDDVPDVCHNSWGVTTQHGFPPCFSDWWSVIDNCEAAGVVVTFSAGNEGPGPGTLRSPGDRATSPTNCFTIGSTAINFPNTVSTFSSRGPSACGGEYQIKPEVMAPGDDIISCVPGGSYGYMSGTSMAGPHVAGVVALMRQAAPNLDVTTIKEILMETAIDLGPVGEENTYGHGLVDAFAAVSMVMENVGSISGQITDLATGQPLEGVAIRDTRGQGQTLTDENGVFHFTVLSGPASLEISHWGFQTANLDVEIPPGGDLTWNVALTAMPPATLEGTVYGPDGEKLPGVEVSVLDTEVPPVVTDNDGAFGFELPSGPDVHYELLAISTSLAYELAYTGLSQDSTLDFHLPELQKDGFESGGLESYPWFTSGPQLWHVTDDNSFEGIRSVRTGAIEHSQESELSLEYYVNGDGNFSFRYAVDSEIAYDRLFFYLDGQLEETWSGSIDWSLYSTELTTGWHTFSWVYSKDSGVSVGQDAAWVDLVELPGTGVQQPASISLSTDQLAHTLDAGTSGQATFQLTNTGAFPLDFEIFTGTEDQPAPPWLSVNPGNGTVYPGNEAVITVALSGTSASAGINEAVLTIVSNDQTQPEVTVQVALTVMPVSGVADNQLPRQVTMTGAVPNPFNPTTAIKFSLPVSGRASLKVYDVSGRLVSTLLDQSLSAGHHTANWNGQDNSGQAMASGVYFARLQTSTETLIKSMVLVR